MKEFFKTDILQYNLRLATLEIPKVYFLYQLDDNFIVL